MHWWSYLLSVLSFTLVLLFVCVKLGCMTSGQSSRNKLVYWAFLFIGQWQSVMIIYVKVLAQHWPSVKVLHWCVTVFTCHVSFLKENMCIFHNVFFKRSSSVELEDYVVCVSEECGLSFLSSFQLWPVYNTRLLQCIFINAALWLHLFPIPEENHICSHTIFLI